MRSLTTDFWCQHNDSPRVAMARIKQNTSYFVFVNSDIRNLERESFCLIDPREQLTRSQK